VFVPPVAVGLLAVVPPPAAAANRSRRDQCGKGRGGEVGDRNRRDRKGHGRKTIGRREIKGWVGGRETRRSMSERKKR